MKKTTVEIWVFNEKVFDSAERVRHAIEQEFDDIINEMRNADIRDSNVPERAKRIQYLTSVFDRPELFKKTIEI